VRTSCTKQHIYLPNDETAASLDRFVRQVLFAVVVPHVDDLNKCDA
jgi:hypothetical protein